MKTFNSYSIKMQIFKILTFYYANVETNLTYVIIYDNHKTLRYIKICL